MRALAAFVRRINLRYWRRHRLRTSLTLLGVTTGVMLVVAVAVVNSTLLSTLDQTAQALAGSADIEVASPDSTGLSKDSLSKVQAVDGVERAVPVLRTFTTIRGPEGSVRIMVLGVTADFPSLYPGSLEGEGLSVTGVIDSHDDLLLAEETAAAIGAERGSKGSIDVPTGTAEVEIAGGFSGRVVDALETGHLAVMPLHGAQEVFERRDRIDSIYVMTQSGADRAAVATAIGSAVGTGAIVGAPGARVAGFDEALNGIATLSSLAGTVALFVAAFVVFNTMSMSIAERRREISLTLALGATRRQVIAGFVGEAAVLGSIASILGIVLGYLIAGLMVQPGLDGLRVFAITAVATAELEPLHIGLGTAAGLGVAVIGSYLPARRVMRVAPIDALRPQASYGSRGAQPSRRGLQWGVGCALLAGGVGIGSVTNSNLEHATWTTNAVLLMLLGGVTLLLPLAVPNAVRVLRGLIPRSMGMSARLGMDAMMRNTGRTTITVGALVFTLGIVIAVGGALDSYEAQWHRSAQEWYGAPIQVSSPSFVSLGSDQPLPASLQDELEEAEGVEGVYPARYRIVNVDGRQTTLYVTPAVEQMNDPRMPGTGSAFRSSIAEQLSMGRIVISSLAAQKKDVGIGEELVIPTPSGAHEFEVGGIVNDLNPLDSVYMSNGDFISHWKVDAVDRYEVTVGEGYSVAAVMANLEEAVERSGIPMTIRTKSELVADTFEPIGEIFSVARAIQLVALIVAALAIANTMFITVLERRWELGLQRAVGMDGGAVVRMLLTEAGAIGIIGSLGAWIVGLGTGYLMVADMERAYAFSFPFELPFALMALTLLVGGAIALAAGAYPSRAALRTPIIESLRFE